MSDHLMMFVTKKQYARPSDECTTISDLALTSKFQRVLKAVSTFRIPKPHKSLDMCVSTWRGEKIPTVKHT